MNELRVVKELCEGNKHENLVQVYKQDALESSVYPFYLDMELCAFNLNDYIYNPNKCVEQTTLPPEFRATSIPNREEPYTVWAIMEQISSGIAFMHANHHVHRDVKPANSIALLLPCAP